MRIKKNRIFNNKLIILLNNKFNKRKVRIINIKKILKRNLVEKIQGSKLLKKYFNTVSEKHVEVSEKHVEIISNIKFLN